MDVMDEIHKSGTETQLSVAALEFTEFRPNTHAAPEDERPAKRSAPPALTFEVTGVQLLLAMGAAFASTGVLLWAVLRLWAFEP